MVLDVCIVWVRWQNESAYLGYADLRRLDECMSGSQSGAHRPLRGTQDFKCVLRSMGRGHIMLLSVHS